ncbi:MAG: hypothetical protein ACYSSP_08275 [Planctomycetota bacterium]|jgi:hypothetical protein
MIKQPLLEMQLFTSSKETENKLRWDSMVGDTKFELYIPKWRVPTPPPSRIYVDVSVRRSESDDIPNLSPDDVEKDSTLTHEPIIATVEKYSTHTKTIRYRPLDNPESWEIGEPYIPYELTGEEAPRLRVIVLWDITSRGSFHASKEVAL